MYWDYTVSMDIKGVLQLSKSEYYNVCKSIDIFIVRESSRDIVGVLDVNSKYIKG